MRIRKNVVFFFLTILIFTLYMGFYQYTSKDKEKRIHNIVESYATKLSNNYKLFVDFFETTSFSTVNLIHNDKQILAHLTDFVDANEDQKAVLRQKLYQRLQEHYETMKSYGVLQFHFVLPNNVTSLRMHKPSKFGDDLTDLKYSFKYVNQHQKPISGLEEGKTSVGFRNIYPLKNTEGKHIGAVDISFAPEIIQEKLYTTNNIHAHFLIKKDIANIREWRRDDQKVEYTSSIEHPDYIDLARDAEHTKRERASFKKILTPFKQVVTDNIASEKKFSLYVDQEKHTKVITFLPIKNLQSHVIGYLVSYEDDVHIHDMIDDYIKINLFAFLVFGLLGVFIYLIIIKTMQLKSQKETYHYLSQHDSLTQLPNRLYLHKRLQETIDTSKALNKKFALLFLDIDNFKQINDIHGHKVGDKLLKTVGYRISKAIRKEDVIARLGGDEFIIILKDIDHIDEVKQITDKIYNKFTKQIMSNSMYFYIHISIGTSIYPDDANNEDDLLMFADSAMYKAKHLGGNHIQFYSTDLTEQLIDKTNLIYKLKNAVEKDEFVIHYQPQLSIQSGEHLGVEVLTRWQKAAAELVFPDQFIPMAEETGAIVDLDRLIMKKAIMEYKTWIDEGLNPGILSLNLSTIQLRQNDTIDFIQTLMQELDFDPKNIEFEITETKLMENPKQYIDQLNELKDLGFGLSIDDFGTGYSSLYYLKVLPIDKLKIDKEFVRDLHVDQNDKEIITAIIALGRSLNLKVVAEGIENQEQLDFLKGIKCDIGQGYYFSKPIDANSLKKYLRD